MPMRKNFKQPTRQSRPDVPVVVERIIPKSRQDLENAKMEGTQENQEIHLSRRTKITNHMENEGTKEPSTTY